MTYDNQPLHEGWLIQRVGQGILMEGGKVLLAGNRWFAEKPLVWTLPGGRAEDGEGTVEALIREFREETGLAIEVGELAYVVEARSALRKRLFLTCAFTVMRTGGSLRVAPDTGVEDLRLVPPTDLMGLVPSPSLGDPLRAYLGEPVSSPKYWFFPEYESD